METTFLRQPARRRVVVLASALIGVTLTAGLAAWIPLAIRGRGVAVILADTNRDGVVDESDKEGRDVWTAQRGALFLPNIGDSAGRGKPSDPRNAALSDAALAAIHDASDDVARATENFAPLRTVPIADVADDATGRVELVGSGKDKTRLFLKRDGRWVYVDDDLRITAYELKEGLELGLDGRDVIRPGVWDGRVTVRFTVQQGLVSDVDEVELRAAPVLTHHHLQQVERIVTASDSASLQQTRFVADLAEHAEEIGQKAPIALPTPADQWAQDIMEPGYAAIPGPGGTVRSIRIIIRSPQTKRKAGRQVFELRGPGTGAIQFEQGRRDEINSMGNLETIPPYQHNGVSYPAGRIITGSHGAKMPAHLDFFRAQGVQEPLVLDTNWLGIGHVDEFVQFLPAKNPRGWTIAVMDPEAGLQVLRAAQAAGHGSVPALSAPPAGAGIPGAPARPPLSIDKYLADENALKANREAAGHIAENLAKLLAATGVAPEEVIRIPALFEDLAFFANLPGAGPLPPTASQAPGGAENGGPGFGFEDDDRSPDDPDHGAAGSYIPAAINGIVIGNEYLAPKQWGPVVDGKDIFAEAVAAAYATAGMTVRWIDDWDSHHVMGGEVHCGTNTLRSMNSTWW